MHVGAPNLDIVNGAKVSGSNIKFTFFVDEQAALYVHVLSNGKQVDINGKSSTIRTSTIGGPTQKTIHVVILRPGTINMSLHVPGLNPGSKVQLTFVDYDGHKVSKILTTS